jgi:hypothetical protein
MTKPKVYSVTPSAGRGTRDCLDPWFFVLITAGGGLQACCNRPAFAPLGREKSLSDVLNSDSIRELRRQLLSGELDEWCANCPAKGLTDIDTLHLKVQVELTRLSPIDERTDASEGHRGAKH